MDMLLFGYLRETWIAFCLGIGVRRGQPFVWVSEGDLDSLLFGYHIMTFFIIYWDFKKDIIGLLFQCKEDIDSLLFGSKEDIDHLLF